MGKIFFTQQMFSTLNATYNKLVIEAENTWEDLTVKQFLTLLGICHIEEGGANYNRIAYKLGTTKQNAKQLVSTLERKGYVTVTQSMDDKRAVNVQVTDNAKKTIELSMSQSKDFLEQIGRNLTEAEMELLWKLLMKLYAFDGEEFQGFEKNIVF